MIRSLVVSACIIANAGMLSAQAPGGIIRIYADEQGTDCNFSDQAPGVVSYYLFQEYSPGASAIEFQLDLTGFDYFSYLGDTSPFQLKIGNFLQGVSISYGTCLYETVFLGAAHFRGLGTTPPCHYVRAKNHPIPGIPEATTPIAVDCWQPRQFLLVDGGVGVINPSEDCQCPDIAARCPAIDSGKLFGERYSADAGFIADPPGVPHAYATRYVEITRLPDEVIYLSSQPDSWAPLVVDDDILINYQSAGPGPYTVLDDSFPVNVALESIFQPELADEIPVSVIPFGTSCVRFDLVDTQRNILGNSNIYIYKPAGGATYLDMTCPDPIAVECSEEVPAPDIGSVLVRGDCTGEITVIHAGDVSNGHGCPEIITRTYQATDDCGNMASCTQEISIIDTGTPVITGGPADLAVRCAKNVPPADVGLITAVGDCEGGIVITHRSDAPLSDPCGGFIDRTYRATNACGNFDEYVQRITVDDDTPPVMSNCPVDIVIECEEDVPSTHPAFRDNCIGTIVPMYEVFRESPDRIRRFWTAADRCGNATSCTQLLTIRDTTPPRLSGCYPFDLVVDCGNAIPDPWNVTPIDNCEGQLASFAFDEHQTNPGSSCGNIITRTWTAVDSSGNAARCTHQITMRACRIMPKALDFGEVMLGYSRILSFVISNPSAIAFSGSVAEASDQFSIRSGGGDYNLAPGESLVVEVRFKPTRGESAECIIRTGSECAEVPVSGVGFATIGVTIQSYSAFWQDDHVEVKWRVKDVSGALSFGASRGSNDGRNVVLIVNPDIVQEDDEFILYDRTAVRGETYTYHVEVKEDGISATSFEATITTPALAFALYQSHPNPFKESTVIGFNLERPENVTLDVFDISGMRVCTLLNRSMNGGEHFTTWNGEDTHGKRAASGIYFYRLRAGNQTLIRKMVLLH
ncbi:MAG: T9SS type A sorting domain-containing protein [Chitinivibrionia bacterium]|nr:T9SS type A sorting domain-containing protein [Chitinivibrionia bacterium]